MNPKITVGMRLFSLNVGNAARHCEQVLTPVVVTKVGRKYFTVKNEVGYGFESTHNIGDWSEKTDYTARCALYESEQEWADEKETRSLSGKISEAFKYGNNSKNLSLETLRMIVSAIDSQTKEPNGTTSTRPD